MRIGIHGIHEWHRERIVWPLADSGVLSCLCQSVSGLGRGVGGHARERIWISRASVSQWILR
jgi:hypothetical protein